MASRRIFVVPVHFISKKLINNVDILLEVALTFAPEYGWVTSIKKIGQDPLPITQYNNLSPSFWLSVGYYRFIIICNTVRKLSTYLFSSILAVFSSPLYLIKWSLPFVLTLTIYIPISAVKIFHTPLVQINSASI